MGVKTQEGGDPKEGSGNVSFDVEIGGEKKTLTPQDVVNMHEQLSGLQKKEGSIQPLLKASEKYGVSPDELVQHMDATFSRFADLVDQGVIDQQGNPIQTKGEPKEPENRPDNSFGFDSKEKETDPHTRALLKKLETVESALQDISGKVGGLEHDQRRILYHGTKEKISAQYPDLNDRDIAQAFGIASKDGNVSIWDAAKQVSQEKSNERARIRAEALKEAGIDPKEFDANKIREQDPDAGTAGFVVKGKTLSFKKGSDDAVSPLEATRGFLSRQKV